MSDAGINRGGLAGVSLMGIERVMLRLPQEECELRHDFAPGVYMRSIRVGGGVFVLGHAHKTEHLNILVSGRASIYMDGSVVTMSAPSTFVSKPGARKLFFFHEDSVFSTIHPTDETDTEALEEQLVDKSKVWKSHQVRRAHKILMEESA